MLGNLSFWLWFIVLRILLTKYDSINRHFVKSSLKSKTLALVQSVECLLSKTCLVSADLSNCRCWLSNCRSRFDKFALTKHNVGNEHFTDWIHAKILHFELDFTKRRFIESYFSNQIPTTVASLGEGGGPPRVSPFWGDTILWCETITSPICGKYRTFFTLFGRPHPHLD